MSFSTFRSFLSNHISVKSLLLCSELLSMLLLLIKLLLLDRCFELVLILKRLSLHLLLSANAFLISLSALLPHGLLLLQLLSVPLKFQLHLVLSLLLFHFLLILDGLTLLLLLDLGFLDLKLPIKREKKKSKQMW